MVDVHCHVGTNSDDIEIIRVVNGINIDSSKQAVELASNNVNVWACVGVHPEESCKIKDMSNEERELKILLNNKKVVGIGEIGLDYREGISEVEKEKQKEVFETQLKLAEESNLPLEIHNRKADEDIIDLIKKYQVSGVMHCFTRNVDFMNKCAKLGWYFSFGGFIMNKGNSRTRKVAMATPEDRLLLETDLPYSATDVKIVARRLAEIRGLSEAEIDRITTENARRLFRNMI